MTSLHLQRELCILADYAALDRLETSLKGQDEKGLRRLSELQDKGVSHSWLWHINPRDGSRMAQEDYILALQAQLDADIVKEGMTQCRLCGEILDAQAAHSMCCSKAESTRGHYAIVSALLDGISTEPGQRYADSPHHRSGQQTYLHKQARRRPRMCAWQLRMHVRRVQTPVQQLIKGRWNTTIISFHSSAELGSSSNR